MKKYITHDSIAVEYPELLQEWDYDKNKQFDPYKIKPGSNHKVWWICKNNPEHRWEVSISCRVRKGKITQCLQCYNQVKTGNSLAEKFPEVAKEWHPTKNGDFTPDQVDMGSAKKVWWQCKKNPNHAWKVGVNTKRSFDSGCPYCYNRKIDRSNCLATTNPDLVKEWHPTKNIITPHEVSRGSGKRIWWQCKKDNSHIWDQQIRHRLNSGCPYCSNFRVDENNCLSKNDPELAQEWDYEKNFPLTPNDVVSGARKEVWWICKRDFTHTWKSPIYFRGKLNTGCPFCSISKGEAKIQDWFNNNKVEYKQQYTFTDCRYINVLRFDFAVLKNGELQWLCEYQGLQHYQPVEYWGGIKTFKEVQKRDKIKKYYCETNNISLLIIPYTEYDNIENILSEYMSQVG